MGSLRVIAYQIDATGPISALKIIGDNLGHLQEPLTKLLELGLSDAREEIGAQGSYLGDGWAPMSPFTPIVAEVLYGKQRTPGTLLDDDGRLVASLVPGGEGNILEVGEMEGEAGTNVTSRRTGFALGPGMQRGTSRTFKVLQGEGFAETGIPARRFLFWSEARAKEYVGIFAEHAFKGVEGGSNAEP